MFAGSGWSSSPTTAAAPRPAPAPSVCLYQFLKDDKGNPIAQPRYLVIVQGDLVRQTFHDAASSVIVNPANTHMLGGEGVDRAVHDAAGGALRKECERLPITAGKARARAGDAFLLHQAGHLATDVIAAVGPDCRFDHQAWSGRLPGPESAKELFYMNPRLRLLLAIGQWRPILQRVLQVLSLFAEMCGAVRICSLSLWSKQTSSVRRGFWGMLNLVITIGNQ
ncbi:hypothetical protein EBZ39_09020 [bacterium]|nr:hypothetical protein [bacterium]